MPTGPGSRIPPIPATIRSHESSRGNVPMSSAACSVDVAGLRSDVTHRDSPPLRTESSSQSRECEALAKLHSGPARRPQIA